MTAEIELFGDRSIVGDPIKEEGHAVPLSLARLPASYGVLVTALEANEDVHHPGTGRRHWISL